MAKKQLTIVSSLTNARNRTLVIALGVIFFLGVAFAISKFRGADKDPLSSQGSSTGSVPNVRSIPGAKAPEKYVKLQREENIKKADDAIKKKTASIPTILGAIQDDTPEEGQVELTQVGQSLGPATDSPKVGKIQLGEAQGGAFIDSGPFKAESQKEKRRKELERRRQEQVERVEKMRIEQKNAREASQARRQEAQDKQAYIKEVQDIQKNMGGYLKGAYKDWSSYTPQAYTAGQWESQKYVPKIERMLESAADGDKVITTVKDAAGNPQAITITEKSSAKKAKLEIIKAGTILFGVLDTAVNSDEPGPVLATIVHGKYKGAKLIGSIAHEARQERLLMNFETMTMTSRPTSMSVKVVAIDANTARTAVGSDVDKHYLLRYGSLFASSFMEGYAKAITEQGTTTVSPLTGTTTTQKPELSGKEEFLTALGEVGKRWGQQIRPLFNMPYTVTVNQGTGLGLLFLSDADVTPKEG
tara:strand:+ start:9389 stop:10807 length:1419 start_codon:yes stop_codon:yes gene_type:complete